MAERRTPLKPSSKVGGDPKEWARKARAFQEKLATSGRAFSDSTEIVRADRDSRV